MKIHFTGVNGVSMRALAELARHFGAEVTGSDLAAGGHCAKYVEGADLVVYSSAVPPDNCELSRAHELEIPVIERAEYLGDISRRFDKVIAVAGCHGKSTATAMTGEAFRDSRPTLHIGVDGASKIAGREYFITEACEYKRSFLELRPTLGIVLNTDHDHPDCYATRADALKAYAAFCENCERVLINGDERALYVKDAATFGLSKGVRYRAVDITSEGGRRAFTLEIDGMPTARAENILGAHNIMNALAALAAADMFGQSVEAAAQAVSAFPGLPRRFEYKGEAYGKAVYTDYAHHPTEIAATIKTARELYPSVAVVFQPHTYSRTVAFIDGFIAALSAADAVILAPIYAAREKPIIGVSSATLAVALTAVGTDAKYCPDFSDIAERCKALNTDAVIFMGAGDIDKAAERFLEE